MINILNPEFLKWNEDNSSEHFNMISEPDSWEIGAETYFNVFKKEVFTLSTYSTSKKEYVLEAEGAKIIKQEQKEIPAIDDEEGEHHEVEIEWVISDPKGHVFITVDNERVGIEWADRRIKDLHGNEAKLLGLKEPYRVEEILTSDEQDTLTEIKRLARLRDMSTGEIRKVLNNRMMEIAQ